LKLQVFYQRVFYLTFGTKKCWKKWRDALQELKVIVFPESIKKIRMISMIIAVFLAAFTRQNKQKTIYYTKFHSYLESISFEISYVAKRF
jgi:hypothetical protein